MPRHKKNAEERRSRHIIFRITAAEYDELCAAAAQAGLSPNELARRLTSKGRRRLVVNVSKRCDPAFLKRIDAIGNNLNQLVKNAHIFGRISPRVEILCMSIDQLVTQATEDTTDDT